MCIFYSTLARLWSLRTTLIEILSGISSNMSSLLTKSEHVSSTPDKTCYDVTVYIAYIIVNTQLI